jgi:hypothetical protein
LPVEEVIKVSLKGDDSGLDKSLQKAERQLDGFGKSVDQVNKKLPQLKKGTVDGTFAMTNLSRVVQDAPYGFVGIANNITAASESLAQLSRQAKESGQSIKSVLLTSLTGAGGLGLALSLVTTALTFASVGFGSWSRMLGKSGDDAKSNANAIREAKKAIDEYVQSLDAVVGAELRGSMNAQEQLVSLQTLYTATQNANIPLADRKKLVDQLQAQYPKYFANIQDETILAGGAKKAYDELSTAILASARARAAQESLVEFQKQLLATEQKRVDASVTLLKAASQQSKVVAQATKDNETSRGSEARAIINQQKIRASVDAVAGAQKEVNDLLGQEAEIRRQMSRLVQNINTTVENNPNALLDFKDKEVKAKEVKVKPEKIDFIFPTRSIALPFPIDVTAETRIHLAADKIRAEEAKERQFQDDFRKVLGLDGTITVTPIVNIKPKILTDSEKMAKDVNASIDKAISGIAIEGLAAFGEAIGNAVSGGAGIEDAFKNIGNIIGTGITVLGKELIRLSGIMRIVTMAIKGAITNPLGLALAGVGLIAVGAVFKNLSIPGFATGGIVPDGFPNDSYLARLTSGERVIPERDWNNLGSMMQPQVIVLNNRLRGRDAVLQQARENRSQRRGG